MEDLKLNKSPQSLLLRELEKRGSGQVRRAWDDENRDMVNNTYFWKCGKELLPSHSLVGFFARGKSPSNMNAALINTAAQGLLWFLLLTSQKGNSLGLKALLPLSALEIAITAQEQ